MYDGAGSGRRGADRHPWPQWHTVPSTLFKTPTRHPLLSERPTLKGRRKCRTTNPERSTLRNRTTNPERANLRCEEVGAGGRGEDADYDKPRIRELMLGLR